MIGVLSKYIKNNINRVIFAIELNYADLYYDKCINKILLLYNIKKKYFLTHFPFNMSNIFCTNEKDVISIQMAVQFHHL